MSESENENVEEIDGREKRLILANLCAEAGYDEIKLPDGTLDFWYRKCKELQVDIPKGCRKDPAFVKTKQHRLRMRKYRAKLNN